MKWPWQWTSADMQDTKIPEKTATHTAGPWLRDGGLVLSAEHRRTRFAIAEVRGATTPEQGANARLIAAAPDMFQALLEVVGAHAEAGNCFYCLADIGESHDDDCTMRFVLEAIAKAEGAEVGR